MQLTRLGRTALTVIAMLSCTAFAHAKGVVTVQQVDGSIQTYPNSTLHVTGKTLRLTSADKKGVLVITDAACSYVGKLLRCLPFNCVLEQKGSNRIPLAVGTIYFNTSGETQQLSFSSTQVPPNGVLGTIRTVHGTYVTIKGTLDSGSKP